MRLSFRVGDVWTSRGCEDPFTVVRLDDRGNVFGRYGERSGITTRAEWIARYRPIRLVGWWRRFAYRMGWPT